jgi:hypothetical protein
MDRGLPPLDTGCWVAVGTSRKPFTLADLSRKIRKMLADKPKNLGERCRCLAINRHSSKSHFGACLWMNEVADRKKKPLGYSPDISPHISCGGPHH